MSYYFLSFIQFNHLETTSHFCYLATSFFKAGRPRQYTFKFKLVLKTDAKVVIFIHKRPNLLTYWP